MLLAQKHTGIMYIHILPKHYKARSAGSHKGPTPQLQMLAANSNEIWVTQRPGACSCTPAQLMA